MKTSRRAFMQSSFATCVASVLFPVQTASARTGSIARILELFISDQPILAVVAMVEYGINLYEDAVRRAKLNKIADQISGILNDQEEILQGLAAQRFVLRNELDRRSFLNDVAEVQGAVYDFQITLASDAATQLQMLLPNIDQINNYTLRLGTYGVAALPAYLAAIALQNCSHLIVGSTAKILRQINEPHRARLDQLLNGSGPDSIPSYLKTIQQETAVLDDKDKFYPLAEIVTRYRQGDPLYGPIHFGTEIYGISYKGTKNSRLQFATPLMAGDDYLGMEAPKRYRSWVLVLAKAMIFPYANSYFAKDYLNIPKLGGDNSYAYGDPNTWDQNPTATLLNDPGISSILEDQVEAVKTYYENLSDLRQNGQEVADKMTQLLKMGLDSIDRIIAARERLELKQAPQGSLLQQHL